MTSSRLTKFRLPPALRPVEKGMLTRKLLLRPRSGQRQRVAKQQILKLAVRAPEEVPLGYRTRDDELGWVVTSGRSKNTPFGFALHILVMGREPRI